MTSKTLALHSIHENLNASFTEKFGSIIPNVYSSVSKEYRACNQGVGLFDLSFWVNLRMSGKDSVDLLYRLSTNELTSLLPGVVTSTVFTNEQGRIVDLVSVLRYDEFLLVVTSPQKGGELSRWIDKFTFTEDLKVEDVSDSMGIITLIGPKTDRLLERAFGDAFHRVDSNRYALLTSTDVADRVFIASALEVGNIGVNILAENGLLSSIWNRLLEEENQFNALPIGWQAFNALRIEKGIPLPVSELREEINPLEANLGDAVSFTKGCYIGQEVIARLDTYKKVQKHLCRVDLEGPLDWSHEAKAELFIQNERIGWITSLAVSPESTKPIGLAYIHSRFVQPGREVMVKANGGEVIAHLTEVRQNHGR